MTLLHALLAFILLTNCKFGCPNTIRNFFFFSQSINFSSVVLCYASVLLLLVKVKGLDSFWLIYIVTHCSNYQSYSKKFLCNFRVRESHSLPKLRLIVLIVLCPYMQTYETRRVSCFMYYVCTQKIYKNSLKV